MTPEYHLLCCQVESRLRREDINHPDCKIMKPVTTGWQEHSCTVVEFPHIVALNGMNKSTKITNDALNNDIDRLMEVRHADLNPRANAYAHNLTAGQRRHGDTRKTFGYQYISTKIFKKQNWQWPLNFLFINPWTCFYCSYQHLHNWISNKILEWNIYFYLTELGMSSVHHESVWNIAWTKSRENIYMCIYMYMYIDNYSMPVPILPMPC